MDIVTRSEVKEHLGIKDTQSDDTISLIVTMVSGEIDQYLGGRILQREITESFHVARGQSRLLLELYPVVSVKEVLNDSTLEFGSDTEVDPDDYVVDLSSGIITFLPGTTLSDGPGAMQVTYTGGFGTTTREIRTNYPALWSAALIECVYRFKNRDMIGVSNAGVSGGAITLLSKDQFLPHVAAILDSLCRVLG